MIERIGTLIEEKKLKELREVVGELDPADLAEAMEELGPEGRVVLFRSLPKDAAAEAFSYLEADTKEDLIALLSDLELGSVVDGLFLDDAADLVQEMPANVVKRLLKNASSETRRGINHLLQYADDSAGGIMTTELIDLKADMTVEQAFAHIRKVGMDKETIYTCYVVDARRVLIGVVTVRTLLLSRYEDEIGDIMSDARLIYVKTGDDREQVTDLFQKYGFIALPVVDDERRLVGIVTVDDAMTALEEEDTEDFQKMAAMVPIETPYLSAGVLDLARKRILWLMVLMISATLSGQIITRYQAVFAAVPALIAAIPMLMDTGGNAGSQSSTLVIRGMAVGELSVRDALRVLGKELRVSLLVGGALAVLNAAWKFVLSGDALLSFTVGVSLFATVMFAQTVGGMLPLLAKALGLDPALMAAPIVTTIVDAGSLTMYFMVASAVMGA